jgi:hypothetical protein
MQPTGNSLAQDTRHIDRVSFDRLPYHRPNNHTNLSRPSHIRLARLPWERGDCRFVVRRLCLCSVLEPHCLYLSVALQPAILIRSCHAMSLDDAVVSKWPTKKRPELYRDIQRPLAYPQNTLQLSDSQWPFSRHPTVTRPASFSRTLSSDWAGVVRTPARPLGRRLPKNASTIWNFLQCHDKVAGFNDSLELT